MRGPWAHCERKGETPRIQVHREILLEEANPYISHLSNVKLLCKMYTQNLDYQHRTFCVNVVKRFIMSGFSSQNKMSRNNLSAENIF